MNPSEHIDQLIAELTDWRAKTFASIRKSILEADREIIEVDGKPGVVARRYSRGRQRRQKQGEATFSYGANLPDPDKLLNACLEGNARRALDFFEGDKINERAQKNLIRAAADYNHMKLKKKAPAGTRAKAHKSKKT